MDVDLDTFEDRNDPITKRQINQLLTLQVLNDSMEVSISFQKTHYGETFAKMPVERDEWRRKCAKLGLVCNFASKDNMQPCDLCGGRHPLTSGCDVTVNLKKVCDESSTVFRGIGELMGEIAKIQAELAKWSRSRRNGSSTGT